MQKQTEMPADRDHDAADTKPSPSRYATVLKTLLPGFIAAMLAWGFIEISGAMVDGGTRGVDTALLLWAQQARSAQPWMISVLRDLSGIGSTIFLTLLTVAAVGYLLLVRRVVTAYLLASSVISGTLAVFSLKAAFGRVRPASEFAVMIEPGLSFPSGHASLSALVFLSLGALLASTRSKPAERIYILCLAGLMTLLVGLSRVALGVHWGSDVLGGWAFGSAWALIYLLLARRLARTAK
ncbi:phosphatase PAP2 family protein [Paucibacter sp. B2R-40]|uniref:phosphatase PAP2 family protein n=1 Tax=Paucibacter sp. B2R-40 TaxID=2893554 RepID=UPI0021E49EC2|nr:phosphatase PAP2 family protein [Paucibacter sp. B2R-40]MCV2352697.1 phosphatase PAP2 family protein [Paucibacter sp. B2R-40]